MGEVERPYSAGRIPAVFLGSAVAVFVVDLGIERSASWGSHLIAAVIFGLAITLSEVVAIITSMNRRRTIPTLPVSEEIETLIVADELLGHAIERRRDEASEPQRRRSDLTSV